MAVDVAQAIKELIQRILGDRDTALQYAEDPEGTLAAQGITDGDLSGVDMFQLVGETCGSVPGLQNYGPSYTSGGGGGGGGATPPPPSAAGHSVEQVMQHLNYVTYVAYEGDETITNIIDQSTNIDQSQNVDVDVAGDLTGDITVDSNDTNVNATGEGAAAAADGSAVSGDGSAASQTGPAVVGDDNLVNTGVNLGQQNTGDNTAQGIALGGGDVVQNTGEFTGQQAGDNANAAGSAFGEGAEATNLQNVTTGPGGAINTGDSGEATGNFVHAQDDAVVQTEQGPGDATQNVDQLTGIDLDSGGGGGFDRLDPVFNPVVSRTSEDSGSEGESQETFEG